MGQWRILWGSGDQAELHCSLGQTLRHPQSQHHPGTVPLPSLSFWGPHCIRPMTIPLAEGVQH